MLLYPSRCLFPFGDKLGVNVLCCTGMFVTPEFTVRDVTVAWIAFHRVSRSAAASLLTIFAPQQQAHKRDSLVDLLGVAKALGLASHSARRHLPTSSTPMHSFASTRLAA